MELLHFGCDAFTKESESTGSFMATTSPAVDVAATQRPFDDGRTVSGWWDALGGTVEGIAFPRWLGNEGMPSPSFRDGREAPEA